MKNGINKTIATLIYDSIDYINMPNSYMLFLSKHTPHAEWNFQTKLEKLKKFAEKNHGELKVVDDVCTIIGNTKRIRFELIADVVVMKEFDKLINVGINHRKTVAGFIEQQRIRETVLNEYKGN